MTSQNESDLANTHTHPSPLVPCDKAGMMPHVIQQTSGAPAGSGDGGPCLPRTCSQERGSVDTGLAEPQGRLASAGTWESLLGP